KLILTALRTDAALVSHLQQIYHSHSLSLTTAADLAMANFARSRSAKSRTSPGSSLSNEND
ncbi:MAG TPA: hypothetical protein VN857_09885, partial [Chthoniobacterales bacterium]|nr:hypothetical protein [Chthoniobacterales bacterium]